ncbi:unnamed protein product [Oppiella nova]|uniref:Lipase domain-containing protein n=1 Tax=Oppiella nova TaxID=334625 RepID=A0A7R9QNT6_9ACAR|nr:unnamed protein product [Oppiella nova]CAG2169921.1 unnamed protein product [Oppiella nova]
MIEGDHQAIQDSHFDATKPTKFIIHGYVDMPELDPWMKVMKDEYLANGEYNVIIVDWFAGNHGLYDQAARNTHVTGQVVANMIKDLQELKGLKLSDVHILGHSLGAHAAGFAGEDLKGQVARITGLDPAGPLFDGATQKLKPTDAVFVDSIHSDADPLIIGFGIHENSGHVDFYPNGGHNQPGCALLPIPCNHLRAVEFYMSSLKAENPKGVALQCASYDDYKAGKCAAVDAALSGTLGEDAIKLSSYKTKTEGTKFFLRTHAEYPYFEG